MKIAVAQLGARMHYAVPRIFARNDVLQMLFTDICGTAGLGRVMSCLPSKVLPGGVRRLVGRQPHGIPPARLTTFDTIGLKYWWSLRQARTRAETAAAHLGAGEALAEAIIRQGLGDADTLYTFNSAGLTLLKHAQERGIRTMHEQTIAPVAVQVRLLMDEQALWPDWEEPTEFEDFFRPFQENEVAEWTLADRILCGSDFVRDGIREAGGPVDRAVVVPYGVDMKTPSRDDGSSGFKKNSGPLQVLTVGTVGLRKGAPYVMAAAQRLKGQAEFRVAGPVDLRPEAAQRMGAHVKLLGKVPRSEMAEQFAWADVFLLPSICEGSATATYEALAWGLPVITTPNAGSPVMDGVQGFVVPVRDVDAIVDALEKVMDPGFRSRMQAAAFRHSENLTVAAYGKRLMEAVS